MKLTLSIDVPDIDAGLKFYVDALGFEDPEEYMPGIYRLRAGGVVVYLLEKADESNPAPGAAPRTYRRHWTPVHLDLEVDNLDEVLSRVLAAGAVLEEDVSEDGWGRIAMLSDPFGHGLCLLELASDALH